MKLTFSQVGIIFRIKANYGATNLELLGVYCKSWRNVSFLLTPPRSQPHPIIACTHTVLRRERRSKHQSLDDITHSDYGFLPAVTKHANPQFLLKMAHYRCPLGFQISLQLFSSGFFYSFSPAALMPYRDIKKPEPPDSVDRCHISTTTQPKEHNCTDQPDGGFNMQLNVLGNHS